MLTEILSLFRAVASSAAGTEVEAEAAADLKAVEGIAAIHMANAEKDVQAWLSARLHPALAQPQA